MDFTHVETVVLPAGYNSGMLEQVIYQLIVATRQSSQLVHDSGPIICGQVKIDDRQVIFYHFQHTLHTLYGFLIH